MSFKSRQLRGCARQPPSGLQVFWPHASVVRKRTGFNSRTDLSNQWACMPMEATDPCKVGVIGSTPMRSTGNEGLMIQRNDTALAWRQSQFDSGWVH